MSGTVMAGRWPAGLRRHMRWVVGVVLVLIVLIQVGSGAVFDELRQANLLLALPAIGGLVATHLLGAATWRLLQWRVSGWAPRWSVVVRTYYAGQALGGITPANLGADMYRLAAVRSDLPWGEAALPIILQRVGSSAALALLGAVGLSVVSAQVPSAAWMVGGAVAIGAVGTMAVVVLQWRPSDQGATTAGLSHRRWRSWAGTLTLATLLGVSFHVVSLLFMLGIVASIAPVVQPLPVLAALAIARLSLLVPFSPSGLGVQEGVLALLFSGVGLSAEVALAASLLSRLALMVTTIVGGTLLARGRPVRVSPVSKPVRGDALPG